MARRWGRVPPAHPQGAGVGALGSASAWRGARVVSLSSTGDAGPPPSRSSLGLGVMNFVIIGADGGLEPDGHQEVLEEPSVTLTLNKTSRSISYQMPRRLFTGCTRGFLRACCPWRLLCLGGVISLGAVPRCGSDRYYQRKGGR